MKKVTCTVIYRYVNNHYELINVTVKHKHKNITLYNENWDDIDKKHAYEYNLFNELYSDVLAFLKSSDFYVHSWKIFENKWYDIDFIDTNDGSISRYSLS